MYFYDGDDGKIGTVALAYTPKSFDTRSPARVREGFDARNRVILLRPRSDEFDCPADSEVDERV